MRGGLRPKPYACSRHAALANFSCDAAQAEQISALSARLAELEAKLAAPPKTPDNSSLPPSKGQKPNLPDPAKKKPRPSCPGVARALAEHPDLTIEASLDACPHCQYTLSPADQPEIHAYDHIDLPPIRPIITRSNRHRGVSLRSLAQDRNADIVASARAAASTSRRRCRKASNPARHSGRGCAR